MIENVVSIKLPVDEELRVQKNRIAPEGVGPDAKRICIVTGTHGDELEGQLVCFELARFLKANMQHLKGIVDIYPALNPLGIDSITRGIPGFDLDMNRTFPGRKDGSMPEYIASEIFNDIAGADVCIDIHASNIFLREIPQIRINELTAEELVPLARYMNVDFVWVHSAATVLESTLAYSLNMVGTKTLVAEMGVGMRLTIEYRRQGGVHKRSQGRHLRPAHRALEGRPPGGASRRHRQPHDGRGPREGRIALRRTRLHAQGVPGRRRGIAHREDTEGVMAWRGQ